MKKTLSETERQLEPICLSYVSANHMENDALVWYLRHYPFAVHEVMNSLIYHDPFVASVITRLYVTDTVENPDVAAVFAESLGMTLGEMDTMLDPETYREVTPA